MEGDSLCRWHRRQISEAASIESSEELPSSSLIDSLGSAGCCLLLVLGIGVVAWRTPDLSPVRSAIGSYVGDLLEGFQSSPAPASSATPTKTPTTTPRTPRLIRESLRLPKYRIGFETSIPSDPVTLILDNGSAQGITVRLDRYRIDVPAGQHAQVTLEAARVSLAVEGFPPLTKTLEKRQTYVYNHLRRNSYLLERRVYALPGAARPTDTEKNVTLRLPQQEFFKTRWPIDYVFEPFPERVEVFVTAMAVKTRLARRR